MNKLVIFKNLKNLIHAFQVVFLAEQDDNVPGFKSFQGLGIENHLPGQLLNRYDDDAEILS